MKWISKDPPFYVFLDDHWYNERIGETFYPCTKLNAWVDVEGNSKFEFTKKTKIMKHRDNKEGQF
jgi:hypothetical protein